MGHTNSMQHVWELLTGQTSSHVQNELPILASLLYLTTTLLAARTLRLAVRHSLPQPLHEYINDAISAFTVCACSLENYMIRKHYGLYAFLFGCFCVGTWFSFTFGSSSGNPCGNFSDYIQGKASGRKTVVKISLQILAGLLSYQYARTFWYLEVTGGYAKRLALTSCQTDINSALPLAFLMEFAGVLIGTLLAFSALGVDDTGKVVKVFCGVLLMIPGLNVTGAYYNPINASNQNFGCRGVSNAEHILVYWISAFLATYVAFKVYQLKDYHPTFTVTVRVGGTGADGVCATEGRAVCSSTSR